ncbi:MAG TPA: MFS transporter [Candidatus Gemmiger excrementipullorum]|uniref:MFS transporter n=1 Tax=Candidatus Gemmiger excrementipullorum TaxID=2838610 RepID=A0A9D2BUJ7_9FIRM|nr:MFS transporter [Candidatus Gemmiger excrementipullorum]
MVSLLLPVIYLAFISLGLPDSVLGAAWPSMYGELGAALSWAGVVSMIVSLGTIVSALCSERLTLRLGPGGVTAVSVLLTAVALLGFSLSGQFWQLCLWAVPYGLGAGSVDAALNNYVALHYESRHMSWLHCMWGLGASAGPVIMGRALAGGSWQGGYRTIALLQFALTAVLLLSLPLWKRPQANVEGAEFKPHPIPELLRRPGVPQVLVCFFCYCALESTAGMWAASYCTLVRGIDAGTAARWASLFYVGITVGRGVSGFLTMKVNDQNMIRLGQALIAAGTVLILLPTGQGTLFAGLITVGLGCAPIYPSIIHETPLNFGREVSMSMTGLQMATAYVGTCLVPPLFGLLAQYVTPALYPWALAVILVLMFVMAESLHRKTALRRRAMQP